MAPPEAAPFAFPREYFFPPFFTRQTNLTTRHAQLTKWSALVLAYCRHHRLFRLRLPSGGELFHNRKINRRLAAADVRELLDFMRREGRAEPLPDAVWWWVYWRTPEEWAALLEAWVDDTAQKGAVLTLYELTEGPAASGTEFHGLDPELLQKALGVLVKRGKAQIFGKEDSLGVKFF